MTRTRPDLRVIPGGAAASAEAPSAAAPKGTRAPGTATRERGSVLQDLYSRYGGTVYGRCFYLLKDRAKAEDAMQDVFAKVLTNLAGFRAEASPLTWLVAITTNHCLNVLRAEKAGWRQRYADEEIARVDAVETRSGPRLLEDREAVRRLLGARGSGDAGGGDSLLRRRDDAGGGRERARAIGADGAQAAGDVRDAVAPGGAVVTTETPGADADQGGRGVGHLPELTLRRLWTGESLGAEHDRAAGHAAACAECARRMSGFDAEQTDFETHVSFDCFAAGVERAAREPARRATHDEAPARPRFWARPASTRSFVAVMTVCSAAAAFALVVGVKPLFEGGHFRRVVLPALGTLPPQHSGRNNIKGDDGRAAMTVVVAGRPGGEQRSAMPGIPEPLAAGERLRVGVRPGHHQFLVAVSVDEQGVVTPIYPEVGRSLPLPRSASLSYLPDSIELTGKGLERLIVVMTDAPLELGRVRAAAADAYRKGGGDLMQLPRLARGSRLALPGGQKSLTRMFIKP